MYRDHKKHLARVLARMKIVADNQAPQNGVEYLLRISIENSLDTFHRWKRFVFSHLKITQVLLDAPRFDDAFMLKENLDKKQLSLYTLAYPFIENAWGEETLQTIRYRTHIVDVVHSLSAGIPARSAVEKPPSELDPPKRRIPKRRKKRATRGEADLGRDQDEEAQSGFGVSTNHWVQLLKKIFPKACSDRDFSEKCDTLCRKDIRIFHFVLESFMATLVGLYRHVRNPAKFTTALSMYRLYSLCRHSKPHRDVMLDAFFTNDDILINCLRENLVFQIGASDSNLWMIDANWISGCCHFIRSLFRSSGCLKGVNTAIYTHFSQYGIYSGTKTVPSAIWPADAAGVLRTQPQPIRFSKPSVYRVANKNFVVIFRFHGIFLLVRNISKDYFVRSQQKVFLLP
jgi:hypothetical protein